MNSVIQLWYVLVDFLSGWSVHCHQSSVKIPHSYCIAIYLSFCVYVCCMCLSIYICVCACVWSCAGCTCIYESYIFLVNRSFILSLSLFTVFVLNLFFLMLVQLFSLTSGFHLSRLSFASPSFWVSKYFYLWNKFYKQHVGIFLIHFSTVFEFWV